MKLQITVTKEILHKSMFCGVSENGGDISQNCAVALAVRDIFPDASIERLVIQPFKQWSKNHLITLPRTATAFIIEFDELDRIPEKRMDMPELTFEVEIPEAVIERLSLPDPEFMNKFLNHPTLKLITA